MQIFTHIAVDLCGNSFLIPYLEKELVTPEPKPETEEAPEVNCAVRIVNSGNPGDADPELDAFCSERGIPLCELQCPQIIGTGMQGLGRRIAAGIYRGTFVHVSGNEARVSIVHATDVARAVTAVAGRSGSFTFHDGTNPTIHDLAEALAYRMAEKRIITIKPRWARLWFGAEYFDILTTDSVSTNSFLEAFPDFNPVDTVNYLHTHVYDESSL